MNKTISGLPTKVKQENKLPSNIIREDSKIVISLSDHWELGYSRIMNSLFIDKTLTSNEIRLLGIMLTFGNYPGNKPKAISVSYMRKLSGLSKNTVMNAIKKLKELGHIKEEVPPGPEQCRCVTITSPYLFSENARGVVQKMNQGVVQKTNPKELTIKTTNLCAHARQALNEFHLKHSVLRREITELNKLIKEGYKEAELVEAINDLAKHGTLNNKRCDRPIAYLAAVPIKKILDRARKKKEPGEGNMREKKLLETIRAAGSCERNFVEAFDELNNNEKDFVENRSNARRLGSAQICATIKDIKQFAFSRGVDFI